MALADGVVVKKGEGDQMEGIYLWLRHAPEDTSLPYWVYSKYQHLKSIPDLAVDARVKVGQVIAFSGKTGTEDGHYGAQGYPHLHLTTRKSLKGEFKGSELMDPLVIYYEAGTRQSADTTAKEKAVVIPYATADGHMWPQGTRVVWPVACHPR